MQKSRLKGSILIWSMFLSLIVVSSFVYISLSVNKNIKLNNFLDKFLNKNSILHSALNSGSTDLGDGEFLVLDDNTFVLKDSEAMELLLSGSELITGTINIINGGVLKYNFQNSSGVVTKTSAGSFTGNLSSDSKLFIYNMAGIANFNIDLGPKFPLQKYKIVKIVGGKNIEKSIIKE